MSVVYEPIPTLPPVAATIVTVCIFIMLAGLAIWIAGQALVVAYVKIVGVHLTLLAAKTKLSISGSGRISVKRICWRRRLGPPKRNATGRIRKHTTNGSL